MVKLVSVLFWTLLLIFSASAENWVVTSSDKKISQETGKPGPAGLPDGLVATIESENSITSAWYVEPTRRYRHAILGDDIEAGGLVVVDANEKQYKLTLPEELVFEDRTPRLYDLEGFGNVKVITIISHRREGAAIAVFGLVDGALKLLDQTPFIGRSNRWRNVAGVADFDGDGHLQIAEVVTPHIGGTLNFWTWKKGMLEASGDIYGFSNHFIGSPEQRLSAIADFDDDGVDDLALPSASRRELRIIGFDGAANGKKTIKEIATIKLPARINTAIDLHHQGNKPVLVMGLSDGTIKQVHN